MEQDSNYNIDNDISGGFGEVRETMELVLPLHYRAKSYQDDAEENSWYYLYQTQPILNILLSWQ